MLVWFWFLFLAKDAPVAIGVSSETDLDAFDIEDEDEDSKRKPDALAYFSDNGALSSPARKGSEEYLCTYGQGTNLHIFCLSVK